ncbi:hypothetical protein LCI18_008977 [Fusarium solani-melongenae]|uniref:Uncharacterized protein n=1 Tax=Fusarium solani subsp. cucurbitae TaxID=2747967 RepID=A0ACD3ZA07_FUSSC|nr:hypothetical protein LCI18_008977 [Fusarium solani-melongenae]
MSLPVFLDCKNSLCEFDGRSRVNGRQNLVAVDLVHKLIVDCSLVADQFVIITPYRANLHRLEQTLKDKSTDFPTLASINVNAADSFQGRKGQIVALVLCVTGVTGPLFVANRNHLRRDIDTAPPYTGSKENSQVQEGDDGEAELIKSKVFQQFLQYFREKNRVVAVSGDETADGGDLNEVWNPLRAKQEPVVW